MLQSRDDQISQFLHLPLPTAIIRDVVPAAAGFANAVVDLSDHPHSDLTCNASSYPRKRSRDELIIPTAASIRTGMGPCPSGFHVSGGLQIESATPSTSDRSVGLCAVSLPPIVSAASPDLLALLYQQNNEIDILVRQQGERLRLGIEEILKRNRRELVSTLWHRSMKRLREKETELENASKRNVELEEKARRMSAESLIWYNLAKNNEAIASTLRTSLEEVMIRNTAAAPMREGYGDSDISPPPADDAQSCCFESGAASGRLRCELVCKVCTENNVSVLVLPCRHLCLCKSCEAGVDTCPICHSIKNATLQIFM